MNFIDLFLLECGPLPRNIVLVVEFIRKMFHQEVT